nr:hypothetical protein [uncultured Rhodopila sp.]
MQPGHLPTIDWRYWLAILIASVCGTNLGDLGSQTMGLGFVSALLPFAAAFAFLFRVQRRAGRARELCYWLMIIVCRAAATNIADLATHELKVAYSLTACALVVLLVTILAVGAALGQTTVRSTRLGDGPWQNVPDANPTYWAAILTASVFGTATGDFIADDCWLGVGPAALVLTVLTAMLVLVSLRDGPEIKPLYWLTIVAVRIAGTNIGDFLAGEDGLNVGIPAASVASCAVLACVVFLRKDGRRMPVLHAARGRSPASEPAPQARRLFGLL